MSSSLLHTVDLQPVGRRVEVAPGTTLLEAAQAAGVEVVSICGGIGTCGECRVRLAEGRLSPITITEEGEFTREQLTEGMRLACQAEVLGPVRVDIPPESLATPQRLQVEGQGADVALSPAVVAVDLEITPPDLYDLRSDLTRVADALSDAGHSGITAGQPVLEGLSEQLRAWDWRARFALRGGEVVAVLPHPSSATYDLRVAPHTLLGLAADLGTTKLAAYLVDLETGETLAKTGAMNPHIAYGEDVVSRIAYTNRHPDGRRTLQERIAGALDSMLGELCREVGAERGQVVDAVVVGNTAMHHLFAGLPVAQLGEAPYVPAVGDAMEIPASALGLHLAPGAHVYLPPNVAGYVGADHISMLVASMAGWDGGHDGNAAIALDIGTNTEISLFHGGRVFCCSCASGPAFEGAHITNGMRAAPGAIERVRIAGDEVQVYTIDRKPAVGICGSGILDVVAAMLGAGIVDGRGILRPGHALVRAEGGRPAFVLAPRERTGTGTDLLVTRKDVNEIQLAKGAIRAGLEILMAEAGVGPSELGDFVVAGAFGTYLDLDSAVGVGMFPPLERERFRQVGNAAGAGAVAMLLSQERRALAAEIARRIEYIELTTHPRFMEEYVRALHFE